jgi:hypothetical protein
MGEGLGWGCPLDLGRHTIGDLICGFEGVPITNAKDAITLLAQPGVARGVVTLRLGEIVTPAIDLDDQPRAVMHEIHHKATERRLAANVKVQTAERLPQHALAGGHSAPQPLRALDGAVGVTRLWWLA